jgi:hypothetical protein
MTKDMGHASVVDFVGVADKYVAFKISSLTEPKGISGSGGNLVDISISIRSVLPEQTHKALGILATRDDDGDGTIEGTLATNGVARKVLIEESVRNISFGIFKEEVGSFFTKTVEGISVKGKIGSDVLVEFKALLSIEFKHDFFSGVGNRVEGDLKRVELKHDLNLNFSHLDFD